MASHRLRSISRASDACRRLRQNPLPPSDPRPFRFLLRLSSYRDYTSPARVAAKRLQNLVRGSVLLSRTRGEDCIDLQALLRLTAELCGAPAWVSCSTSAARTIKCREDRLAFDTETLVARGFIQLWADYSVNSSPRILSTGKRGCVQPRQLVPSTVNRRFAQPRRNVPLLGPIIIQMRAGNRQKGSASNIDLEFIVGYGEGPQAADFGSVL